MTKINSIYQVFTGRWPQASLTHHPHHVLTRMSSFPWKELAQLGFDTVYVLGLFDTTGPCLVSDEEGQQLQQQRNRCPSPFAITDHSAINPLLGTQGDFIHLLKTLQASGLRVAVDFVPNHTSTTHPWVVQHPDYYVYEDAKPVAEFSGDVYKLNYDNLMLRKAMLQVLEHIAMMGVDAIRCDMAHLIPLDFWFTAITRIKNLYPHIQFIAEAYTDTPFDTEIFDGLSSVGFDYIYHELLYRNLANCLGNQAPITHLVGHIQHAITEPQASRWLHYVANHDDPLVGGQKYREATQALLYLLPGAQLSFNGVLQGRNTRLAHHYVELLTEEEAQFTCTSKVLDYLLNLVYKHGVRITSVEHHKNLLVANIQNNRDTKGVALFNFSDHPADMRWLPDYYSVGVLHTLPKNQLLPSGSIEIFMN